MYEKPQRKLVNIRQALFVGDKYLSKFDALSISVIEIDDNNNFSSEVPRMEGMRSLASDINGVLNEAYMEQQQPLVDLKMSLADYKQSVDEILGHTTPQSDSSSGRGSIIDASAFLDSMRSSSSVSFTAQGKTLEKQLRPKLIEIYESVSSAMDSKIALMEDVQEITDFYVRSVVSVAAASSVLRAEEKVNYICGPHLPPLLHHRLFDSGEEQELLSAVRRLWSHLVVGDGEHSDLAERQLARGYFGKTARSAGWGQNIKIGVIGVLLLWSVSEVFNNERKGGKIWDDPTFAVFMCFGDFLLLLVMWGVSMQVWRSHGIDFVRLLQLEETELAGARDPAGMVYESSSTLVIVFLATFIVFNKAVRYNEVRSSSLAVAHAIPILLVLFFLVRIVHPLSTRKLWLHTLWRVLAAPFYQICFRDGYIGDLLTSLVRVLIPLSFSFTYLGVSIYTWLANDMALAATTNDHWWKDTVVFRGVVIPFLTLLPLWLRLVQCLRRSVESGKRWPHIGNALKYTSAMVVIAYGTFQPIYRRSGYWVACFVFATLFQFAWDLTQDWGMLEIVLPTRSRFEKADEYYVFDYLSAIQFRLRAQRLLGPVWVYLLVIAGNLVLRFAWTLTLLPNNVSAATRSEMSPVYLSLTTHVGPLIAAGEILRRMVWGFFRLEWEQLEQLAKQKEALEAQQAEEDGSDVEASEGGTDSESLIKDREASSAARVTLEMEMMNKIPFEKMGTMTSLESSGFEAPLEMPSPDLFEFDWTRLLPPFVRGVILSLPHPRGQPFEKKLRLVEAVLFASVVVYLVLCAALPSFSEQGALARLR